MEAYDTPGESEVLFPAMAAVSMGWYWSLFSCNEAVAHKVSLTGDGSGTDALRVRSPAPLLQPGRCVTGTYVDNVQTMAGQAPEASLRMGRIGQPFSKDKYPST